MFSARAHSFRQQARLAVSLSWVGGFVNVLTFLECAHLFTSHLTGAVTLLGTHVVDGAWRASLLVLEVCVTFFAGAMASAVLAEVARVRRWPSRYVFPVALEAVLLGLMCLTLELDWGVPRVPVGLAAFAMGLQNGTITQISGAVVRSTHVTGVVTDLGLEAVQAFLWWRDPARRVRVVNGWRFWEASSWHPRLARLALLGGLLTSFLVGIVMGAVGHQLAPRLALLLPIVFLLTLVWRDWREPIGEIRELDPLGERDLREHGLRPGSIPTDVGVFWLGRRRPAGAHPDAEGRHEPYYRAPDFQAWMERLPLHVRRPVLVLSPHVHLDADAALDLDHVARRLREGGRRLVLAGLSASQHVVLSEHGCLAVIGADRVFPEVSQALAALQAESAEERAPEGLRGL